MAVTEVSYSNESKLNTIYSQTTTCPAVGTDLDTGIKADNTFMAYLALGNAARLMSYDIDTESFTNFTTGINTTTYQEFIILDNGNIGIKNTYSGHAGQTLSYTIVI